jgi:FAD/FMN-containing dehydrogenase
MLRRSVGDCLIDIDSPLVDLVRMGGVGADQLLPTLKNPYLLSDTPGLTQSLGWIDAWTSHPSVKGVAARSTADVAAAIDFGRRSRIPLVVKGGGHSYFGNSNRAGSLLIWTHRMRDIALLDAFVPQGAPKEVAPTRAVSVGTGCRWGEVYRKMSAEHGLYVQGGGCLTVGVGGFTLGGGFGSLSKQFGTGAANLLEAEVVTADGKVRIVNKWREPELFYALRGGGGGTFGVATRLTLRTHALPDVLGEVTFGIKSNDAAGFHALAARMIEFYASNLFNPLWGEQIRFGRGRRLKVDLVSHSLSEQEMRTLWSPFLEWVRARRQDYSFSDEPQFVALSGRDTWDPAVLTKLPGAVLMDNRPGAPPTNIYWTGNGGEAAQTIHAYQSAWIPAALLAPSRRAELVDMLVSASNLWSVTLHTNKGLGGGSAQAVAWTRETATNPEVLDSFALLICGAEEQEPAYPGIPGHEPHIADGREDAASVRRAMAEVYKLVPGAGAYMSECDYFLADWKRAHWGSNYPRLAAAKRRYDPHNLFTGHHCVEVS